MIRKSLGIAVFLPISILSYSPDKVNTISFPGGNFLRNWSFEEGVSYWTSTDLTVLSENGGLWGAKSLKVTPTTAGVTGILSQELALDNGYFDQKRLQTLSGKTIRFSVYVKPQAASTFTITIQGASTVNQEFPSVAAGAWTKMAVSASGMLADANGKMSFRIKCHSGNPTLIDDAILEVSQGPFFHETARSALFTSNSGMKIQSQGILDGKVVFSNMRYDDGEAGGESYAYFPTSETRPLDNLSFSATQYESSPNQGPSTTVYRSKAYNLDPVVSSEHVETQVHLAASQIDGAFPSPGNPYLSAREVRTFQYLTTQGDLSPGTLTSKLPLSSLNRGQPGYVEPAYSITETVQRPSANKVNLTRVWTDGYGREMQTAETNSSGTALITTRKEYDLEGNVTKISPPKGAGFSRTNVYEKFTNRLISTASPDEGLQENRFLKSGLLKFQQDAKQKQEGVYFAYVYDGLKTLLSIHVVKEKPGHTLNDASNLNLTYPIGAAGAVHHAVKEYYHGWDDQHVVFGSRNCQLPGVGTYELKNVFFRVWRVKIPDDAGTQVNETVDQYYSYDENGNITDIFAAMDNRITLERLEYALNGGVVRRRLYASSLSENIFSKAPVVDLSYKYNSNGDVHEIHDNRAGQDVVIQEFEYDIEGRMTSLTVLPADPNRMEEVYDYNSIGWLTKKISDYPFGRFISEFNYDVDKNGQFTEQGDGRITQITRHTIGNTIPENNEFSYKYDAIGQMTELSSLNLVDPSKNGLLDAKYEFGDHREITSVERGSSPKVDYEYYPGTHQLKRLSGNLSAGRDLTKSDGNFEYYPNGLLKKDFSRNLLIKYDWRNLPSEMRYYTDQTFSTLSKKVSFVYNVEGKKISEIEGGQ